MRFVNIVFLMLIFCTDLAVAQETPQPLPEIPNGNQDIGNVIYSLNPTDPYVPEIVHTGSLTIYNDGGVEVRGWATEFTNEGDVTLGKSDYDPENNPSNGFLNVITGTIQPNPEPIDPDDPSLGNKPIPTQQVQMIINGNFEINKGAVLYMAGVADANHEKALLVAQKDVKINDGTIKMAEATIKHDGTGNFDIAGGSFSLDNSNLVNVTGDMNISGGAFDLANNSSIIQQGTGKLNITGGSFDLNKTNPNDTNIAHIVNQGSGDIDISKAVMNFYGKSTIQAMNGDINITDANSIINLFNDADMRAADISLAEGSINLSDKSTMNATTISVASGGISASGEAKINGDLTMTGGNFGLSEKAAFTGKINATNADLIVKNESVVNASSLTLNGAKLFLYDTSSVVGPTQTMMTGGSLIQLLQSATANVGTLSMADSSLVNLFNNSHLVGSNATITDTAVLNLSDSAKADFTTVDMDNGGAIYLRDNTVLKATTVTVGVDSLLNASGNSVLESNLDMKAGGTVLADKAQVKGNVSLDGSAISVADFEKDAPELYVAGNNQITGNTTIKDGILTIASGAKLTTGSVNLQSASHEANINLSGQLKANVVGGGANTSVNYKQAGAFVDGDISNTNIGIFADSKASELASGAISNIQDLKVDNANIVLNAGSGAGLLNKSNNLLLNGNAKVTLENDFTATNSVVAGAGSTIDLGKNTLTSDTVNFGANSNLRVGISDLANYGKIAANTITIDNTARLSLSLANSLLDVGDTAQLNIFDAASVTAGGMKISNNNMYSFVYDDATKVYDVTRTAGAADVAANFGGSKNSEATASAWLDGADFKPQSTAATLAGELNDLAQFDGAGYVNALDVLAPNTDLPVQVLSVDNANKVFSAVGSRLSGGLAFGSTGQALGKKFAENSVWVQGLYDTAELENAENIKGFNVDSYGGTFGLERRNSLGSKIGVGYAYIQSELDSTKRTLDADSHTGFVYGEFKPNNWYINTIAAYTFSSYDEEKTVISEKVKANFDANTYSAQVNTGYELGWLTPEVGARYVSVNRDGYIDSVDQKVGDLSADVFTGLIGLKLSPSIRTSSGVYVKPQLAARATYDFSREDELLSVVSLPNGSSYDVTSANLDKFGIEVGASITLDISHILELSAGYEGRFRKDYTDHAGMAGIKVKF